MRNPVDLDRFQVDSASVLEAVTWVVIGVNSSGWIEHWNRGAEEVFGIARREILGRLLLSLADRLEAPALFEWPTSDAPSRLAGGLRECRFRRAEGQVGFLDLAVVPRDPHGAPGAFVIVARDVTEHRELEIHLRQAQKLESIGQLAAGIAHEINTPIQYVGDNLRFLAEAFQSVTSELRRALGAAAPSQDTGYLLEEAPQAIAQSLEGIERVASIVRAMKEFSHPDPNEMIAADVNHGIQSTVTVSRNEWKYWAEVVLELDPELPHIQCFPGDLNQVVLNLIVNAAHAIEDAQQRGLRAGKGKIVIATRLDGESIVIRVTDDGIGIPEAIRSRIFEPFFTTKQVGRGTGQGLSIARMLIERKHGGTLRFETKDGVGTSFEVRVPTQRGAD